MSLALRAVSHVYGDRQVLTEVDFTVEPGETVAVVGSSGSGKTTMISILGGLLRPTRGQLVYDGRPLRAGRFPPGDVAWVFQTVNLFGHRTALDNVAVGMLVRGVSRRKARQAAETALTTVGLADHVGRRANTLSGGEAQRVGIARALVSAPRYVLADEPTGQLDPTTSQMVGSTLFDARPAQTAVVVATHDLDLAARCQRVVTVIDGRPQTVDGRPQAADGRPEALG